MVVVINRKVLRLKVDLVTPLSASSLSEPVLIQSNLTFNHPEIALCIAVLQQNVLCNSLLLYLTAL